MLKTDEYLKPGAKTAVFFLGPYATPMMKLNWAVRALSRAGYSVITYEYSRQVFENGDPNNLFIAIDKTRQHIQAAIKKMKAQGYTEFGFIGNSLGSFVIYNCLGTTPELSWGILITGGNLTDAVWSFTSERQKFETNGYTRKSLAEAWYELQYPELGNLSGKSYLLITSKNDRTTHYAGAMDCFNFIKAAGPKVTIVTHHRFSHVVTIVWNLLRIRKLVQQVRSTQ